LRATGARAGTPAFVAARFTSCGDRREVASVSTFDFVAGSTCRLSRSAQAYAEHPKWNQLPAIHRARQWSTTPIYRRSSFDASCRPRLIAENTSDTAR